MLKILISIMLLGSVASATEVGVILGSQAGLSAKFDLAEYNRAIDLGVSYRFYSGSSLSIHSDYLIEKARTFHLQAASPLHLYYGLGGRFENIDSGKNSGKTRLGVRAPVGVTYEITNPDVTFFGELAMVVDFAPDSFAEFTGGIGARLRF